MKQSEIISDLHESLRDFLASRLHWKTFREVQVKAYAPISRGQSTLICAPTASGKTEAALLPLFNRVLKKKAPPLFCLYISPLKALLEDCYDRLSPWRDALGLEIALRHGDRPTPLAKLCQNPPHMLMLTPETLEVILVYRETKQKKSLFRSLQAVIIDEVHYLVSSHRGAQLSSLLQRVSHYAENGWPQIIGLSASVGAPEIVAWWLDKAHPVHIVDIDHPRAIKYKVFYAKSRDNEQASTALRQAYKSLVFVPSRAQAEKLANHFSEKLSGSHKVFVHHAAVDKDIKQKSQEYFKQDTSHRVIMVATSTLELGIDIGDLDVVVHYHPPHSADSFLQRSGRAGRRQKPAQVLVIAHSAAECLIGAAQISLALQHQVEPQQPLQWPYDVLLQQLLCLLLEYKALPQRYIWQKFLNQSTSFETISESQYCELLDEWVRRELIDRGSTNFLSLGWLTERNFGRYNYKGLLSNIPFVPEFTVFADHGQRIGHLEVRFALTLEPGDEFLLAGEAWCVEKVLPEEGKIFVKPGNAEEPPHWSSGVGGLSFLVARECWRLLTKGVPKELEDSLASCCHERLNELHALATQIDLQPDMIPLTYDPAEKRWHLLSFAGHAVHALLRDVLRCKANAYGGQITGFSVSWKGFEGIEGVWPALSQEISHLTTAELGQFVGQPKPLTTFGRYLPPAYLAQANADLIYDLYGLQELMRSTRPRFYDPSKLAPLEKALLSSK